MSEMKKLILGACLIPACAFADSGGSDINITADFIYWKVREEGLGFAETGSTVGDGISGTNVASRGSDQEPDFDWEPGFKVGVGLDLGCDCWDTYIQYTYLRTDPGANTVTRDANNLTDTLKNKWHVKGSGPINDVIFASGAWKFDYNVIDWELGRGFCPTTCLQFRPFFGLKGAWFNDDYTIAYQLNETNFPIINVTNDNSFWGVGLRAGFGSIWSIFECFGIYGDVAFTGLVSCYDITRKDVTTPNFEQPTETFLERNTRHDFTTLNGILEFGLGLRYDTWFCDCCYHLAIQAGWEEHLWINFNKHYVLIEDYSLGDLALYGLTVKASFGF